MDVTGIDDLKVRFKRSRDAFDRLIADDAVLSTVSGVGRTIGDKLGQGGKVLFFGNGGSAGDSQHLAAEFVGHLARERGPLPALALTVDTSALTAIGNDYGYEHIFSRQASALAGPNDVAIGLSTSGNSKNVVLGLEAAHENGAFCVGMTGAKACALDEIADVVIHAPAATTMQIQELHIAIGHILVELAEEHLGVVD